MEDFTEDLPGEAPIAPEEAAYRASEGLEFQGETLKPFSYLRRTAAMALGLRYWTLTKEDLITLVNPAYERLGSLKEELDKLQKAQERAQRPAKGRKAAAKGTKAVDHTARIAALEEEIEGIGAQDDEITIYNEIGLDAAIVLWLCLQPDSICHKARRNPKEWQRKVDAWAEKVGIFEGRGGFSLNPEAVNALMILINSVNASSFDPDLKKDEDSKN